MRPLLVALLLATIPACSDDGSAQPRPNVIIWLVDTLRADHLGCYGYGRPTSPNLDRLAAGGVLVENAHVHCNWTQPSVASILSGVYPPLFNDEFADQVPPGMILVSEWFKVHGYDTYGITLNAATASDYGFGDGYDQYLELFRPERPRGARRPAGTDARTLVDAAIRLLEQRQEEGAAGRPFLLYLHTMDPHEPYTTHRGFLDFTGPYNGRVDGSVKTLRAIRRHQGGLDTTAEDRRHLVDLYDGEIAYNDAQFARFQRRLEQLGAAESTLTVLVSDHGEEMFEHGGQGHSHRNLHVELTHVPLVFHWPETLPPGLRLEGLVGAIDLAPTLVDLAGLPPLPDTDGRSLGPAVRGQRDLDSLRPAVPRVYAHHCLTEQDLMAVRGEEFLFVLDDAVTSQNGQPIRGPSLTALYDITRDPGEIRDIAGERPDLVDQLTRSAREWIDYRARRIERLGERVKVSLDPEMRRILEELGYLR